MRNYQWELFPRNQPTPYLSYGARIASILKHHCVKLKTIMTIGFAQTENGKKVVGVAKYIDREGLVEWLKRIPLKDLSDGLGLCRIIMEDDFKKAIKNMPKGIIIDVSPVRHGRWECQKPCPVCGENRFKGLDADIWADWEPPYCPNCGAKMDEEPKK